MFMKNIGFIGAGNMANAIINGMLSNNVASPENIFVFDVDSSKLDALSEKGVNICKDACETVRKSRFVFLAVKPQNYGEVLETISTAVTDNNIIVSIAAGISINYVVSALKSDCGCVRVMPNTPLLLGCGATALCPSENISDDDFEKLKAVKFFNAYGQKFPFPEIFKAMNESDMVYASARCHNDNFAMLLKDMPEPELKQKLKE